MKANHNRFPVVMKSTAIITAIATALLAALHQFLGHDWLLSCAVSVGTTCYHFAMRLAVGSLVPLFTKNISYDCRWFRPRKWEPALYNFLNVKTWKGALPTYDPSQFDLQNNTLEQVIRNTCNAETVHEVIIVFSFIPLLFAIPFGVFPVFLITSIAAALYDSIFVIAQRYNRPRLVRILRKKEVKRP